MNPEVKAIIAFSIFWIAVLELLPELNAMVKSKRWKRGVVGVIVGAIIWAAAHWIARVA